LRIAIHFPFSSVVHKPPSLLFNAASAICALCWQIMCVPSLFFAGCRINLSFPFFSLYFVPSAVTDAV
jgi:hypothetical protein